MSAPRTARARARAELTHEIKDAAGRQLTEVGAAALSLRAVARELGMASSAVYRYFASRDELLTALIIDAYDAVGAAAEDAEAAVPRGDHLGRWLAAMEAARAWALAHPQQYALIFGSPVPGYRAPQTTADPASRIPLLCLRILGDADAAGALRPRPESVLPAAVRSDLEALSALVASGLGEELLARTIMAWTQLIGSISFELFGHLNNVIRDYDAYFTFQMRNVAHDLGL
ncbi:TetR/AcrR family transcriptional regulator [Cryptosporangium phraense]|uniref:TetR/AcrR family transcriptional regulator n=1 Tax=Cryptosporangium phraense TaxID=2593070 RepID=A0A545ANR9_9ACTN|nr:TetR/AcrR family transcriptional regulator [Cryptosporangium phraense]TQS42989.1 TetR/AcrR family transcriptional regulator [Cryptosporangium phraense]